jgi:hypothetical protein
MVMRQDEMYYRDASELARLVKLGLLLLAVLAAGCLLLKVNNANEVDHAVVKHGAEAEMIRCSLDQKGASEIFKVTSWRRPNHFIRTCQLDDDRWGLQIIQKTKNNGWIEKTAFVVKDGSRFELVQYVTMRAVKFLGNL